MSKGLSVIVPCFNEASRCDFCGRVDYLNSIFGVLPFSCEVIFVDDGSTDCTRLVLEDDGQIVYSLHKNQGKYCALEYGIQFSKYDTILMLDSDLDIELVDVLYSYKRCSKGVAVVGFRNARVKKAFLRRLLSATSKWVSKRVFKLKQTDTQCGYKMFSKEDYREISDSLVCKRYLWDMEFLKELQENKVTVEEVPIDYEGLYKSTFKSWKMLFGSFREFVLLLRKYGL